MRLAKPILAECEKLISRHSAALAADRKVQRRFVRATGVPAGVGKPRRPAQWEAATHFNPFRVRTRAEITAKAIEHKLRESSYSPRPSLILPIPKPGGGTRQVSVFPVADSAVASVFFRRIQRRNQSRLSPFTYAYREDVGAQDAIARLNRMFQQRSRLFVVEFDFSKYFDTISHAYLLGVLRRHFKVTRTEFAVIEAFLRSRRAFGVDAYRKGQFSGTGRGVPQGNSLSLFLANAACHELDLALGSQGFQFARYADDIVVLCGEDHTAGHAFELIAEHCSRTGLAINFAKSEGISECSPKALDANVSPGMKAHFDYLGHRFQFRVVQKRNHPAPQLVRRLSIRPTTEHRIRTKLSDIIYSHLLRYAESGHFKASRISFRAALDWDLVTAINDLRGYVYGGMDEDHITSALRDRKVRLHRPAGIMAFFPQVNDLEQLKALDGWLLHALASALHKREHLLRNKHGVGYYPRLSAQDLLDAAWYDETRAGIENDVRVPSFVRAWKYAHRGLRAFNLRQFPARSFRLGDEDLYG